MKYLVLITSVINIPNRPLSYTNTRSIYTKEERLEQTKKTIYSVQKKIPDALIFIVECSLLNNEEEDFLKKNSNYFLNLYDNDNIRERVYGISKSLGEGTLTYNALTYIQANNIEYDNLIKISGRYLLSDNFDLNNFTNDSVVIKYIDGNINNVITSLYKLPHKVVEKFKMFLNDNFNLMYRCIGYEVLFSMFVKSLIGCGVIIKPLTQIGVEGGISVSPDYYIG
jgi:hypothetical protein